MPAPLPQRGWARPSERTPPRFARVARATPLDVLVARDEGLFEAEGVDLRIAALPPSVPGGPTRCMPRELFGQFPTVAGARLDHQGVLVTYLADVSQG